MARSRSTRSPVKQRVTGGFATSHLAWALDEPRYGEPPMRPPSQNDADWSDEAVGMGANPPRARGVQRRAAHPRRRCPRADTAASGHASRQGAALSSRRKAQRLDIARLCGRRRLPQCGVAGGYRSNDVPRYLLIYATPTEVPWHIQFALNPVHFRGPARSDWRGPRKLRCALLESWKGSASSYASPVVWAVDHGAGDITALMRDAFAEPVYQALAADDEMTSARFIDGRVELATLETLYDALNCNRPSLVVTSSHGMTGPLSDLDAMRANLGLPVDQDHNVLSSATLLKNWQPDGAIWYAQACCSAGSDSPTSYAGLFEAESRLDHTLTSIAKASACSHHYPRPSRRSETTARLHRTRGTNIQLDPEFPGQRTIAHRRPQECPLPSTGPRPTGGHGHEHLLPAHRRPTQQYIRSRQEYDVADGLAAESAVRMLVYSRVTAHDRASTVILGDPTAAIPLPPGRPK